MLSFHVKLRATAYIAALPTVIKEHETDFLYRVYVTDSLRATAAGLGNKIDLRFYDMTRPQKRGERTPEQIIANIRGKLREVSGE